MPDQPSPDVVPLRDAVSAPDRKAPYTRWVFATIADRYDLVNVLLSFNRDRTWKRRMVERVAVKPGERALDLACGTGDITFRLAEAGAHVVGLDITPRMIELARKKGGRREAEGGLRKAEGGRREAEGGLRKAEGGGREAEGGERTAGTTPDFLVGDMMALPFPDASFDIVTTGYGLRNVPDMAGALAEIARVLRPGGRLFSLDFNRPSNAIVRWAYLTYLSVVGAAFGWALYGKPTTYRYIPETIRLHPGARALVRLIESTGFGQVTYRPVFGGFMALHSAIKPDS